MSDSRGFSTRNRISFCVGGYFFPAGVCIHDERHGRVFTPLKDWKVLAQRVLVNVPNGFDRRYAGRSAMNGYGPRTVALWERKWASLRRSAPELHVQQAHWNVAYSPNRTVEQLCALWAVQNQLCQDPLYTPFEDGVQLRMWCNSGPGPICQLR